MKGLLEGIVVGAALLLAFLFCSFAVYVWRHWAILRAYNTADLIRLKSLLPKADINSRIALNVALGRYTEAVRASASDPNVLDSSPPRIEFQFLLRINAGEALVELGEPERALALLRPPPFPTAALMVSGRIVCLAWIMTSIGDYPGALAVLATAKPADLGKNYVAEAFLTRTLILLNLGRLDDAKAAVDECRRLTVRASTERNLLLHEARWQVLTGRIDEAITTFHRARDHRWPCQGGSGCLALGDAFRDVGRLEFARECWSLAVERDPESHSAKLAQARLA